MSGMSEGVRQDILIDFLKPGMVLIGDLFTKEGIFIWPAKKPITQSLINDLKSKGISELYYTKVTSKDLSQTMPPMFSEEVKEEAKVAIDGILNQVKKDEKVNVEDVRNVIEKLFKELITKLGKAIINLSIVKNYDEYTYTHLINVTVLSMFFSKFLGASDFVIKEIGMGAILHDVGKVKIPTSILYKPGELTEEELKIIKKHPIIGYFAIKDEPTVSTYAKKIVLFHHERFDGNGYPLGLKFDRIGRYPQIVSLADIFDALTSERPYKQGMSVPQTLNFIMKESGVYFEPILAQKFIMEMSKLYKLPSPYAIGSFVLLNTGEKAVVIQKDSEYTFRPVVIVVESAFGRPDNKTKINLALDSSRYIVRSITEIEEIERLKIVMA
jgi:HD-GYP domain-containing protein (c-di-GMP phosphodiesterase class II)